MLRKVLALFAGCLVSICLLMFLDPYAPTRGIRILEKTTSDPETSKFLSEIAREKPWAEYDIPYFKRDHTFKHLRELFPQNGNHPYYEYPPPNQHAVHEVSVLRKGALGYIRIFRESFSTDDHSRRTTMNSKTKPEMSVVLLGCSFTWGNGVKDEETFASVMAREEPRIHVYNLGMRGAGPNDTLDDIAEHPNRWSDIRTKKGVIIYTMIADHLDRATCGFKCYLDLQGTFRGRPTANRITKSRYVLENGQLVRRGRFFEQPPWVLRLKRLFFSSRILRGAYYMWTQDLFPEDLMPIAKMLEKIMIETRQKTGYEFYVTGFPDYEFERLAEFKALLEQLHVPYIDYSQVKFNEALGNRGFFAVDEHPSRLGHEAFGRLLLRDLRKREPLKELALSSHQ